ncbi:MAG: tryptophan synthase subunit alpha [candidate division WOR-3 bacterium]|nr:tryptophan synthase subunit alpha [candidate division WOR-3 bacterium]
MSRIAGVFKNLAERNESALITYITAGYPGIESSIDYIRTLARYADMIEIGIPFSDPIADGRTIQYSSYCALKNGISISKIFGMIEPLNLGKPIIFMSYLNPIIAFGVEKFFKKMKAAGTSGLIVPDLVIEESGILRDSAQRYAIDLIYLIAPTSDEKRIKMIGEISEGFVYCVSVTGTTGARERLPADLFSFVKKVKSIVKKPVVVGFGISDTDQIKALSRFVDGVVIGSRLIEIIQNREDLNLYLKKFKEATIRSCVSGHL